MPSIPYNPRDIFPSPDVNVASYDEEVKATADFLRLLHPETKDLDLEGGLRSGEVDPLGLHSYLTQSKAAQLPAQGNPRFVINNAYPPIPELAARQKSIIDSNSDSLPAEVDREIEQSPAQEQR